MRYGKPSIEDALHTFHKLGLEQVITLPLYPQYASCTVGTTFEKVMSGVSKWRHIPSLSFVSGYYNQSAYIEAGMTLAQTLNTLRHFRVSQRRLDRTSRRSPKSTRFSSPITACHSGMSTSAIRISSTVTKQPDWWRRSSVCPSMPTEPCFSHGSVTRSQLVGRVTDVQL